METGVYTITNIITNHIYVGCTTQSFETRWAAHKRTLNRGTSNSVLLQRAWKKYGQDCFKFEKLVTCNKDIVYSEEHYWATLLNTHNTSFGYNLKPTHPENLSLISEKARLKIKEKATGRKWSEEYKKLFRGLKLGKKQTKLQIINAAKGKYKPIIQLSLKGKSIKEWDSLKNASISLNIFSSNITRALKNNTSTAGGFKWKYKEL